MAYKTFTAGLVMALASTCLCQQQQQQQSANGAVSQASFQTGSAAVVQQPQIKLEDIERDSLTAAFGQKTQQQSAKSSTSAVSSAPQQQQQAYQTVPQQQYFVQPYQAQQPFYVQPYQTQQPQYLSPYQTAFEYNGVQYMIVNPSAYNSGNQMYYVPAVAQLSGVPQYVTKPASNAAQTQQEYKQQKSTAPGNAPREYQQQSYSVPSAGFQYVQQAAASPVDFSYVTRHPVAVAQTKAPATVATVAVQPQLQYTAIPQQYLQQQQQQPQYYYNFPAVGQVAAEQPRVQQSAKSQYSSGVKSTTPTPLKESFAYKFESSPPQLQQQQQQQQQQQSGAAYSTLRYSI